MKRTTLKIITLSIFVVTAVGSAACNQTGSEQTPSAVLKTYFDLAHSGKTEQALDLWIIRAAPHRKPARGETSGTDPLVSATRNYQEYQGQISVIKEVVRGSRAAVAVSYTFKNGNSSERYFLLELIDGRWLIDRSGLESETFGALEGQS